MESPAETSAPAHFSSSPGASTSAPAESSASPGGPTSAPANFAASPVDTTAPAVELIARRGDLPAGPPRTTLTPSPLPLIGASSSRPALPQTSELCPMIGRPDMAPATMQEEEGKGSGSSSRSGRWLRRSQSWPHPPASSQGRRPGPAATREESKGSQVAGTGHAAENSKTMTCNLRLSVSALSARKKRSIAGEDTVPSKRRNMGNADEEEAAAASGSAHTQQDSSSESSSTVSSPLREPYLPRKVLGVDEWGREILEPFVKIDEDLADAHFALKAKYFEKCCNQAKLVTLDEDVPHACLSFPRLESKRESITEMILKVARVVFGISSYIGGKLLKRASGFIVNWDKESKVATLLTSAFLLCLKSEPFDEWSGYDEYAPNAEVCVHLLDKGGTYSSAELMHYDRHYNFALLKFKIELDAQIPSFTDAEYGQDDIVLGRDKTMDLIVDYGIVPHIGPTGLQRNQYMFTGCKPNQCAPGGPVMGLNGQILGMVNLPNMAFTPSAIICKCLHMLEKFDCIPRLQTGMKFSSITFLGPVHRDKIIRQCGIEKGLIVTLVSEGSAAEKKGIRNGDIVECWNGEPVSTTLELESLLLHMSEEHLNNGGCNGSTMDVPVGIFQVRKDSRISKTLTLKLGDGGEVIAEGKYAVTAEHCAILSNDDVNSGKC